ncbi:MAG TPA: hypothetical protein DCO83_17915 [Mucilaginibacter sp.]|jgi:hypothetical protein|nr:hypothetical protein [Mucilaginibacter sp.]
MDNSFFAYMQQLELMAFFSGYPLIYSLVLYIAGTLPEKNNFKTRLVSLLPYAYALIGTLYLGDLLRNMYPDYSIKSIIVTIQQQWLIIWGLLSLLFWIPAISKRIVLSLIHSLVFLFFLGKDLFLQLFTPSANSDIVRNDMKIYGNSLLLNLAAFAFILLMSFLFTSRKSRQMA